MPGSGLGVSGRAGGSPIPSGGGGVATRNTGPYIYIYTHTDLYVDTYAHPPPPPGWSTLHAFHVVNEHLIRTGF